MVTWPVASRRLLAVALLELFRVCSAADYLSPGMPAEDLVGLLGSPQAPLIVDVRKPAEYAIAHIPGAMNIPHTELAERIGEVVHNNGLLIYCFNGSRTREAEHILLDNNVDDFHHLEGTFEKWLQGGYPVEKGGAKRTRW
jgi:rhodanese-related sulfurtransferase